MDRYVGRIVCYSLGLGWCVGLKPQVLALAAEWLATGAVLFYIITNTLSWSTDAFYAKTLAGWWQALTIGHPNIRRRSSLEYLFERPDVHRHLFRRHWSGSRTPRRPNLIDGRGRGEGNRGRGRAGRGGSEGLATFRGNVQRSTLNVQQPDPGRPALKVQR